MTEIIQQALPKADVWFSAGKRILYDYEQKMINPKRNGTSVLSIWHKRIAPQAPNADTDWLTMMPGFPDGSFGWAATESHLQSQNEGPRLYLDYVGMGDSDKPGNYTYSVVERADLVEALWQHHEIKQTLLVTFDFSSLVALELLNRQIERSWNGEALQTRIRGVLFINGGYFADAHSHPLLTTPLLKTAFGRMGAKMAQRSTFAFNTMMKDLWSKDYQVTKAELAENHKAISRRNGTIFMSDAAGFVDEHRANASRWDLKKIFEATYPYVKYIVAGSEQDQFEPKQVIKAQKELQHQGLIIDRYPGGHMTTSEHPELIAGSIQKLKSIS